MIIKGFQDLEVWKKAIVLVKNIYLITQTFPKEETYGMTSQIRRAAVSIPSNIAEGKARQSKKEYVQFLFIALGSTAEVQTQIIIAKELQYITEKNKLDILENLDHIARMLRRLIQELNR